MASHPDHHDGIVSTAPSDYSSEKPPNQNHGHDVVPGDVVPGDVVLGKSSSVTQNQEASAEEFKPSRDFLLALMALMIVVFAVALDATTVSVSIPIFSTELGGTALEAFWSGTSFLLGSCVLQPTIAALSSIFGRKNMIFISLLIFAGGSIIGALAGNMTVVLVGRTIQGIGGGGLLALSEIVVTDLVPLAQRGVYISYYSIVWSLGTVTGPLIGAGFSQNVTWRWIFWINLPIIGLGFGLIYLYLNQTAIPGGVVAKLLSFDWTGSFLFTVGTTSLLFGISTGGVMYNWDSWRVLLPLLMGVAILAVFTAWEIRWASTPIIHPGLFNNIDMWNTYIFTIFHGMIVWSILYFLVLYYQGVKLMTPIQSGLAVLPETITVAPSAAFVGTLIAKTGRYRWSVWSGWALITLGMGLLLLLQPETTTGQWIGLNIPVSIGMGFLFTSLALTLQAACKPELNPEAAAIYSFLRVFGQSLGLAVSGVIFQNSFRQKLDAVPSLAPLAAEYSRDATIVVNIIQNMDPSPDRDLLIQAYSDALHTIYIALTAFSGFCTLLSTTLRKHSLNQAHVTKQQLVHRDGGNKEAVKSRSDIEGGSES